MKLLASVESNKTIAHAYVVLIECFSKNKKPVFIKHLSSLALALHQSK